MTTIWFPSLESYQLLHHWHWF